MSLLTQASLAMSDLLADRQRTVAAPPAAPDLPTAADARGFARLMLRAAEADQTVAVQAAQIRALEAEVALLRGKTQPRMPAGAPSFMFSVPLGSGLLWCVASNEDRNWRGEPSVEAMWINGEWVHGSEFEGPLALDVLEREAAKAEGSR